MAADIVYRNTPQGYDLKPVSPQAKSLFREALFEPLWPGEDWYGFDHDPFSLDWKQFHLTCEPEPICEEPSAPSTKG